MDFIHKIHKIQDAIILGTTEKGKKMLPIKYTLISEMLKCGKRNLETDKICWSSPSVGPLVEIRGGHSLHLAAISWSPLL